MPVKSPKMQVLPVYFTQALSPIQNDIKEQQLGVSHQTLVDHGAVSEETVLEMAQGALKQSNADYAIAVSGIAGPDGGSEEKPVGYSMYRMG